MVCGQRAHSAVVSLGPAAKDKVGWAQVPWILTPAPLVHWEFQALLVMR